VKLSSPIGNQEFPLGTVAVSNGLWQLSYKFTVDGERTIVAEGFGSSSESVAEIASNAIELPFLFINHANQVITPSSTSSEDKLLDDIYKFSFIKVTDLAHALKASISWDGVERKVTIS
jgi:hypothetical protein